MSNVKKVVVAYGSQTGNAESIAKDLAETLSNLTSVECASLNSLKGTAWNNDSCLILLIICSTTGNGDAPENADTWWRSIKLRSASKEMFAGIQYAVLGLGDTNYDKFCHVGKAIDKRVGELGGSRTFPLHCADEATNLEEVVETWKKLVTEEVQSLLRVNRDSSLLEISKEAEKLCELSLAVKCDSSDPRCGKDVAMDDELRLMRDRVPDHLVSFKDYLAGSETGPAMKEALAALVETASKPMTESIRVVILPSNGMTPTEPVPNLPPATPSLTINNTNNTTTTPLPPLPPPPPLLPSVSSSPKLSGDSHIPHSGEESSCSFQNPFLAPVISAEWLTSPQLSQQTLCEGLREEDSGDWGRTKRVVRCSISISNSGVRYNPGDSIGICCPNLPYAVEVVFQRLQQSHSSEITSLDQTVIHLIDEKGGVDQITTLHELLAFRYDLIGTPKKAAVLALSHCCQDERERQSLRFLAGKDKLAKTAWKEFIESQGLGIADLLYLFTSCRPALQQLVNLLVPLPPRYYSIASSPLSSPDSVDIAFSLVRNTFPAITSNPSNRSNSASQRVIKRVGVCTSYLEHLLAPFLYPSHPRYSQLAKDSLVVRIFHKPTLTFHLPGSVHHPLILIGPGTGVAPFMSFLEHRLEIAKERQKHRGGELISSGVWRGGFELEGESDLPCEGNQVNRYIHSVTPGPIYLFYGCRNDHDYLFRERLEHLSRAKILTSLNVAFSRPISTSSASSNPSTKEYVTHHIYQKREEISKLILEEHASIYICGDGNQMAKDVQQMLKQILTETHPNHACLHDIDHYWAELRTRRRLLLDIWS